MDLANLRHAIRLAHRRPETDCVADLLRELATSRHDRDAAVSMARDLVTTVRDERRHAGGVDQLMHEFSLSSQEGIALMCLAEALLRIPDTATADRLIRDKIAHGDWAAHLGHSPSLFVNAATWGLLLTGKLVATHSETALGGALSRLLARGGEPLIRRGVDFAMRQLGQQFVMGQNIDQALSRAAANESRGYRHSYDMLGEAALTARDATQYEAAYRAAIHAIGKAAAGRGVAAGPGISVKLSALHPRYERRQRDRVLAELLPRLTDLARLACSYDIGFNIDAEESERLDLSLDLVAALAAAPELTGWHGLGVVVQAYQKRCPAVIDYLIALARRQRRRLMIRLVKGAYWDSEIKRCQIEGQTDYPVYTRKAHTDLAYLACAERLLAAPDAIYPQFATHNAHTLASVLQMARARGINDYEFQCLHGMGETLYDHIVGTSGLDRPCRIYAPVGSHETLLPYLVRRLLENGANSSFVNRLVDDSVSITSLIADPAHLATATGGMPHPALPTPPHLFGNERINSLGTDLNDDATLQTLDIALAALDEQRWHAAPLGGELVAHGAAQPRFNPARQTDCVGEVIEADAATIEQALTTAHANAKAWHTTSPALRATCLLNAATLLEKNHLAILSLCLREAGKTLPNAVAELREAVDFCRYYALQLGADRFTPPAIAPGPVACISPWNFPLAIFVGEIAAALAAGSPVLAKPAEQTPLIAHFAVQLFHEAGVPSTVLQLLPGDGAVGAHLCADPRVKGVVFTGSTEVARDIARRLADRGNAQLIAETGGVNAMIVDSSALPEQAVHDILASGFDSAGQRCSALRLLCLQEDIASTVLVMLRDAMAELRIGDPRELATDVGPVIDESARAGLLAHIERIQGRGFPVHTLPLPADCAGGCYVAPTLIEINAVSDLPGEVFGPIVHVLRYRATALPTLIEQLDALGYGLTRGLHSRIDETIDMLTTRSRVGNLYVNRNMVGAVVGVQPFGGEGLSGTGPKAGGPLYVHRLAGHRGRPPLPAAPHGPLPWQLTQLMAWAEAKGRHDLRELCLGAWQESLLDLAVELPGPTGERNTLRFEPRGTWLCVADDEHALLAQLAAVFASGNDALLWAGTAADTLLAQLPAELASEIGASVDSDLDRYAGILYAGSDAHTWQRRLAAAPGPLRPLCQPDAAGRYALHRLFVERVVTINTAAAGGNAALMTLAD